MQKIVVKIGSSSLTTASGHIDEEKIKQFVDGFAAVQAHIILVTSGAVAAGFDALSYQKKPTKLHEKQACAAIGQVLLMQSYHRHFLMHHKQVAQILLTRHDFSHPTRLQYALSTLETLIQRGVIPIINENDTVAVEELNFGDNDTLSALVANLIKADELIILTDTPGLYTKNPYLHQDAKHIDHITHITDEIKNLARTTHSKTGTGGMKTKLEAARIAQIGGIPTFIGQVQNKEDFQAIFNRKGKGTYIDPLARSFSVKKQWLGFHAAPSGILVVDKGAEKALLYQGASLLSVGLDTYQGAFHSGDVVEVQNKEAKVLGRGITQVSSTQLQNIQTPLEVIHRDNWVTLFEGED